MLGLQQPKQVVKGSKRSSSGGCKAEDKKKLKTSVSRGMPAMTASASPSHLAIVPLDPACTSLTSVSSDSTMCMTLALESKTPLDAATKYPPLKSNITKSTASNHGKGFSLLNEYLESLHMEPLPTKLTAEEVLRVGPKVCNVALMISFGTFIYNYEKKRGGGGWYSPGSAAQRFSDAHTTILQLFGKDCFEKFDWSGCAHDREWYGSSLKEVTKKFWGRCFVHG